MRYSMTMDGKLPKKRKNLSGQKFGMLTALHPTKSNGKKLSWLYQCDCGQFREACGTDVSKDIKKGRHPSCGCQTKKQQAGKKRTHGMSQHPAFAVWRAMKARCYQPSHPAWKNYGGRGISVCESWRQSFSNFWNDMKESYESGLELERSDNSKGYFKENCLWRSRQWQANNRRTNIYIPTAEGEMTISEASEVFGINVTTLCYRLKMKWPKNRLLIKPDFRNKGFST